MRYLILVKGQPEARAGRDFLRQLAAAGVLLDAATLAPAAEGWRVRQAAGRRSVHEAAAVDALAATLLIQVRSRDEALEWSRRFPLPEGGEIELRGADAWA